jgi:hypothetical protein
MIHHMCETWSQHTWWLCSRPGLGAPKPGCDTHTLIFASWSYTSLRYSEAASHHCSSASKHSSPWFSSLVHHCSSPCRVIQQYCKSLLVTCRCSVASLRCQSLRVVSDLRSRWQKNPQERCPKIWWWCAWSSDSIYQARSTNCLDQKITTDLADSCQLWKR